MPINDIKKPDSQRGICICGNNGNVARVRNVKVAAEIRIFLRRHVAFRLSNRRTTKINIKAASDAANYCASGLNRFFFFAHVPALHFPTCISAIYIELLFIEFLFTSSCVGLFGHNTRL